MRRTRAAAHLLIIPAQVLIRVPVPRVRALPPAARRPGRASAHASAQSAQPTARVSQRAQHLRTRGIRHHRSTSTRHSAAPWQTRTGPPWHGIVAENQFPNPASPHTAVTQRLTPYHNNTIYSNPATPPPTTPYTSILLTPDRSFAYAGARSSCRSSATTRYDLWTRGHGNSQVTTLARLLRAPRCEFRRRDYFRRIQAGNCPGQRPGKEESAKFSHLPLRTSSLSSLSSVTFASSRSASPGAATPARTRTICVKA